MHPVYKIQECSYFLFEGKKEKISKYCLISILNQARDQANSRDKYMLAITIIDLRNLYLSCLTYSYLLTLRHPFNIIYLPHSCEASSHSFFLPSHYKLNHKGDGKNLSIKFINFERKYEKLSDFTLIQAINLTTTSKQELCKCASKIWKLKIIPFLHAKKVLKQIDENYPF